MLASGSFDMCVRAREGLKCRMKMGQCDLLHSGAYPCRAMDAVHPWHGMERLINNKSLLILLLTPTDDFVSDASW